MFLRGSDCPVLLRKELGHYLHVSVCLVPGLVCCAQQTGMHICYGSTAHCYLPT
jgi:hypothetical protein